jgi:putative nucleotidyltransferase with HDIG domain
MILIVVSDHALRHSAGRVLAARGFPVRLASTGQQALALLKGGTVGCAVVDAVLQDMNGQDLLQAVGAQYPALPIIMIQGSSDTRAVIASRERGSTEYLAGPVVPSALVAAVSRALGEAGSVRQPHGAPAPVATPVSGREDARQFQQLAAAALDALVIAMEAKDPHLVGHSIRVAELAASMATHLGLGDREVEEVRLAGRLHDIGMIAINDGILTKPGKLTPEEFAEVKRHPILGHQILVAYPTMERVASYVRGHHERWDGKGYPDGLTGETIPQGARILAAAEIFDALTTSRSYRSAESVVEALERMHHTSSEAIDPVVMRALQTVVYRRRTLEFIRDDESRVFESSLLPEPAGAEAYARMAS